MRTFIINGTTYRAIPFDFNLIVELEDNGVSLSDAQKKPMSLMRLYFSLCANRSKEWAGKEIEQHLINGGKFDDILTVMSSEMEDSDFFRNLNKKEETEVATTTRTKRSTNK